MLVGLFFDLFGQVDDGAFVDALVLNMDSHLQLLLGKVAVE